MKKRPIYLVLVVIFIAVALPLGWWLASPLFIQNEVNEAFPFDVPTASEIEAMSPAEAEAAGVALMEKVSEGEMSADEMAQLEQTANDLADQMGDKEMIEPMPEAAAEWVAVASGTFRDSDAFHQGSGSATIYQQGEQRILRLEEFEVTNGPDLHVLLVENADGGDMGSYVDLGSLKGNIGDQNYEIPADVDLSQFSGIMIYCVPFHVVFSIATFN